MISKIAIAAVAMIALGIGGFFLLRPPPLPVSIPPDAGSPPQGAWIEVAAPPVTERDASGALLRELASGDALADGAILESGAGAKANIHFPDGSVARLDEKSRITLAEKTFDAEDKTLRVRTHLLSGRVWSKVMSLATPASLWEVKTSNTVVAVRGTAFGVEFEDGNSRVIGAKDTITVAAIDPDTQDIIPGTETLLKETEMITVRAAAIPNIKARPGLMRDTVIPVPPAVRREQWIENARREDETLNQSRNNLRPDAENREETGAQDIRDAPALPLREQAPLKENAPLPVLKEEMRTRETAPKISGITPQRMSIELQGGIRTLAEGEAVALHAFVLMSDGARREVTKETTWRVIGPIGTMDAGAIFHAELLPPITEVGEGVGAIVGTWKDARSGATLTAQTPILRVELLPQKVTPEG